MKTIQLTILFLLLFIAKSNAQQNCDCELAPKLIPSIVNNFNTGNIDSAEFYIKQFNNSKTPLCKANYLDGLAQIELSRNRFDIARSYIIAEFEIVQKLKCDDIKPTIRYYNTLSRYYTETNNLDSQVLTDLKVVELASAQKDKYGLARALNNAASALAAIKEYEKANQYFQLAFKEAMITKDTTIACAALVRFSGNNISIYKINKDVKTLDSINILSSIALRLGRYPQDFIEILQAYNNISYYYTVQKNYAKAINYADSVILKSPKGYHDFDRHLLGAYEQKANIFYEQKKYTIATEMADSAYKYAMQFNTRLSIDALKMMYLCAKELNNTDKALWAHEQMTNTKDSIYTLEKNKTIQELEKKYNQAKNEKTITELSQQKKIYLLCIIAAIGIIGAIILYVRQQKLKHQQIVMETEQRLNRARMNPHFFFNTLASLQSFALTENDNINLAANISKFSHIMRETLESTYKEYVTIEQEIDFLNEYLELQKLRFPNKFSYLIEADKSLEVDELQIPSMIIQPFVENALEHGLKGISYDGILSIQFRKKNEELTIEINDNGIGLSTIAKENGEHISRASQIIRDRIYLLNIKLKTKAGFMIDNNTDGKGVSVKIHLPLLYK